MNTYAILGGDSRQQYMEALLKESGCTVTTWGLGPETDAFPEKALHADCILLPLPITRDGEHLWTPGFPQGKLALSALMPYLRGKTVLGGMVPEDLKTRAAAFGVEIWDYYDSETVQVLNAIPTAEGAIALAMAHLPVTLWGTRCLVLGCGRIGRVLTDRLLGLGAVVTVVARKPGDLAHMEARGACAVPLTRLHEALPGAAVVFNTVPFPLLEREQLTSLSPDALLMELASAPGGIDRKAAEELGLSYLPAPGLPGKAAPKTAAEILLRSIQQILMERGKLL